MLRITGGDGGNNSNGAGPKPSDRTLIAEWVRQETVLMKNLGISFANIAKHITRAARGLEPSLAERPDVRFEENYRISEMACCKAYRVAKSRTPVLDRDEMLDLLLARHEELYSGVVTRNPKGDPAATRVASQILEHIRRILDLHSARMEHTVPKDDASQSSKISDAEIDVMLGRLERPEQFELSRLHDKMTGRAVVPETGPVGLGIKRTTAPGPKKEPKDPEEE
jgi:hypothetical protein